MNEDRVLIKGAYVRTGAAEQFDIRDILIEKEGGRRFVRAVEKNIEAANSRMIDAFGMTALPSFTDVWARMGEPGSEKTESISTGTNAAVNGGYSTVAAAPFGKPACDTTEELERRYTKADASGRCRVLFYGALSAGCQGKKLCDYSALAGSGACGFSDGMYEKLPDDLLYEAMSRIKDTGLPLTVSPRLPECYSASSITLGRISRLLGIGGIPAAEEPLSISRCLLFAAETGCRLHITGVSTECGIEMIAGAKRKGMDVTASAFPYSFSFSEDDVPFFGSLAKVWPPLRRRTDTEAVRSALRDGTLDFIASGHTPLPPEKKKLDIAASDFGVTGLQTAFSAVCTYVFGDRETDLARLSDVMSVLPSAHLGITAPSVAVGMPADICLVSLDRDYIVTESYLKSASLNSIFKGLTLKGFVERVFSSEKD